MRRIGVVGLAVSAAALAVGCGPAPQVVQGTVVSYDQEHRLLVIKDERPPGEETAFSLTGCEVGADPQPGDEVRLAYADESGGRRTLRVMNLTRQSEVGRQAKPAH